MYTLARLEKSIVTHASLDTPEAIRDALLKDLFTFMGEWEQYDDITLIVLKVK
jgi:serine phosphatase RsbU (regulator of sigma subunit)